MGRTSGGDWRIRDAFKMILPGSNGLWLTTNHTGQDTSTTQRFKEKAKTIGYGRTVPWITIEHSAEVLQVDLILDHGL
jgi:hypothetical protein